LKRAGVFMSISFKVVMSWTSLWTIAWLTFMQNVAALEDARGVFNKMPS